MIKYLKLKNFSLIKDLELEFDKGLNVIHGESGSGKSLILHALSILCGSNASQNLVREGEEKAILECDFEGIGVIQKVISKSKNIQSVDGENLSLVKLKELIEGKIENHSQGEQEEIYTKQYQNNYINQFCEPELSKVNKYYDRYQEDLKNFEDTKKRVRETKEKVDFYTYQLKEIEAIDPQSNEDVELELKIKAFSSKEAIQTDLLEISNKIEQSIDNVNWIVGKHESLKSKFGVEFIFENTDETVLEFMKEWRSQVSSRLDTQDHSEESLDALNQRSYDIQKLKKKLGKQTCDEIIEYRDKIEADLNLFDDSEKELDILKLQFESTLHHYKELDKVLLDKKHEVTESIIDNLKTHLVEMGFTYVEIDYNIQLGTEIRRDGTSSVEFLVSFNKGFEPKEMRKIVSGGEASRLALAMKLAAERGTGVMILDEVDTGLSGRTVEALAKKLKQINGQIICVTHSKEIINEADRIIEIYKEETSGKTETKARSNNS